MKTKIPLALLFIALFASASFAQIINTIAGAYYGDGQTTFAIGIAPINQVVDAAGNIYFPEPDRHIVRKLSASGVYSTVAGTGILGYSGDGGPATTAQLKYPYCIARDSIGNIYIADSYDNRIRKVSVNGTITTIAGNGLPGFSGDGGPGVQAQLWGPNGIAVDRAGNVYVTDYMNHRVRKISPSGTITTIAGNGNSTSAGNGGPATAASLAYPLSVTLNRAGEIFISDVAPNNVRKISTNGIITAFAGPVNGGSGFSGDGGPATSALFSATWGLVADTIGNVYIADNNNNRIRKVNTSGIISTIAGNGIAGNSGDGGLATAAQLLYPNNMAVDAGGSLVITAPNKIRKVSASGIISTVAGNGSRGYNGDNIPVGLTQLYKPQGLAIDKQGSILYADNENSLIRKITASGTVITVAGTLVPGFSGDGGPAANAQIRYPSALAIDTAGTIFFSDVGNSRIRKIDQNGIISTVAGNGIYGYDGDGGPATAAQISSAFGMAVDKKGNIFITDGNNHRIRRIDPNGIITTIGGNGAYGFSGDGGSAMAAAISNPDDLATDSAGNIFINSIGRVRKIDMATGIISTVAGNGLYDYNGGDGGPATSAAISIASLAVDNSGNLLIGDYNGYIRKVNTAGIISTIAGGGSTYGDGGPVAAAQIASPNALAIDKQGNIYVTDAENSRIRKIAIPGCGTWTGAADNKWENPQNWTCGQIPNYTTDVILQNGSIRINSNVVVKSLKMNPAVNLTVATSYKLTVLQ